MSSGEVLSDSPHKDAKATVTAYYYYLPEDRKAAARAALRRHTKRSNDSVPPSRTDDGMANVALEEIWNLLMGHR